MGTLKIAYSKGTSAISYTDVLWLHSSLAVNNEGWKIRYDGWAQGVTQYSGGVWSNVEERITVKVTGTSADDLSAKLIVLDTLIDDIQYHITANSNRVYWLFSALSGEAAPNGDENNQVYRQCPIISIASSFNQGLFARSVEGANTIIQYTIVIKRKPFWEGMNYTSGTDTYLAYSVTENQAAMRTVGGEAVLSNTVKGTSPSRIMRMTLSGESGGGGPIVEAWLGFRSAQLGTPSEFTPIWEIETAGTRSADTTIQSEASDTSPIGSSINNKLVCDFSNETAMGSRAIITVEDAVRTSFLDEQRGRHLVLLRAKVTGDRTAYVRMDSAYEDATNWATNERILVDSTDWYLYPLGYITIPYTRLAEYEAVYGRASTFGEYSVKISAQSASGSSGNLEMDCLVMIPQDDGAVYIGDADIDYTESIVGFAALGFDPLGNSYAVNRSSPALFINKTLDVQFEHFAIPVGSGTIAILAAQRASSQVLADTLELDLFGRFRWRSLRGAEGWS